METYLIIGGLIGVILSYAAGSLLTMFFNVSKRVLITLLTILVISGASLIVGGLIFKALPLTWVITIGTVYALLSLWIVRFAQKCLN